MSAGATDARIRAVAWRDLVTLSPWDAASEMFLPLPWLGASLWLAGRGLYVFALPFSFVFFLTGLRIVHNAYHYSLGIPRGATEGVMALYSVLMLGSMHAIQWNHLRHHKHCLGGDDIEGASARLTALGAIAIGPLFPLRLHRKALREANTRQVRWIRGELAANLAWIAAVFALLDSAALRYQVAAMALGQCLTAFSAVWSVHNGCDGKSSIACTLRNRAKSLLTFNMFFHVEHHLFPKVPTRRLHILARRLDPVAPELSAKLVF
jgi:fatty acid desaturase